MIYVYYLYINVDTVYLNIQHMHDIYIYIPRNAWALTQRCCAEGSNSQSNVVATLGNIKIPPPLNSTFNWEDQNGIREY